MRLRELYETINLFEAYDTKVAKLQKDFAQLRAGFPEKPATQWGPAEPAIPGDPSIPDENQLAALVSFAEQAFKSGAKPSEQAMQWYLTLLETFYKQNDPKFAGKFAAMIGQYQFTDFSSLNTELAHFFTSEYADSQYIKDIVKAIRPATTQVDNLITNATAAEQRIYAENEAARQLAGRPDIELMEGDQVILPVDNKYDWWWLPHHGHEFESKAMGHCGSCQTAGGNLLSLRTKRPIWPELTFEWDPQDKMLYQTKGPKNSKPAHRYRPAILKLMLSDLISGIGNNSYQPANDFSVFDFEPSDVKAIADQKPNLITGQIEKYPIDFLRAPEFIRAIPEFRDIAVENARGLAALVDDTGKVNTSLDAWEDAIQSDRSIIIYAPEDLEDYEDRIIDALNRDSSLLGFASAKIRSNHKIMSEVIRWNPESIELVPLRAPTYEELAIQAVTKRSELLKAIPVEKRTYAICHTAAATRERWSEDSLREFYELFNTLPFTKNEHSELAALVLQYDTENELLDLLPAEIKTYVSTMARLKNIEHRYYSDNRSDKVKEIVDSVTPGSVSNEEYMKICLKAGELSFHEAVPEEFQTYEYFKKYILTIEPTERRIITPFFTDAIKRLPPEQLEDLISIAIKLCPESYFELPLDYKGNVSKTLKMIQKTDKPLTLNISADLILAANEHDVTDDDYDKLIAYYKHSLKVSDGSTIKLLRNYPLMQAKKYNNDDWLDLLAYGAKLNLTEFVSMLAPDFVDSNFEWVVDTICKAFGHTNSHIYFSLLTDRYPEVAAELFKRLPASELGKNIQYPHQLYQMYEADPRKFKRVLELMVEREPDLIADAQNLVPDYIPETEQSWLDRLNYKGFTNGGIKALIYNFPMQLLTPELLNTAIVNAGKIDANVERKIEELYKYYKDKPEYEAVLENMLNLVPNIITMLSPQEIELFHVNRYIQNLANNKHSPENILLHLRREPFPSVAYLKPEIAEYLNKYKAEKAPGLSSISF